MNNEAPFKVRGVIEGFYGAFYTPPERNELIEFIAENGYNLYIYGPKNDRQHRMRWREPYPEHVMSQFKETIALAKKVGVDFSYSIGSGVTMNYASEEDLDLIKTKFKSFYDLGVRTFGIMLDDISAEFRHEEEKKMFNSYAEAHVYVCNKLYDWLQSLDASCKLMLCPTDYHGIAPFSAYIHNLGAELNSSIDIFYTGADITTPIISEKDTSDFANAVKRKPIIWDNYPVNDLGMTSEMHLAPITGRDATLANVSDGFAVNTMSQKEASKIALLTFKDYFEDPVHYDAWSSWENALKEIGGVENYHALKLFAENSLYSCLGHPEAETLEKLTNNVLAALEAGEKAAESDSVQKLYEYLDSLDEAGYHLKFRMENYALRNELLPWIELLESQAWAGRRAIAVLRALENGDDVGGVLNWLNDSVDEVKKHPKRIAGEVLSPLIEYTFKQTELQRSI